MSGYPRALDQLIDLLRTLPSVGKRSAERMALSMLQWDDEKLMALGSIVTDLHELITECPECGNLSQHDELCSICLAPNRDKKVICVVEEPTQIRPIENSGLYKGVYHVLGGKLAPLKGKTIEDLTADRLLERTVSHGVKEVIIALSPDVEGQATAAYLSNMFNGRDVEVTRLAQGLPAGSDISFADSATIAVALNGRTSL